MTTNSQSTSPKPSYRDLSPRETGGSAARTGFEFQDHVAVHFCIGMLEPAGPIEVWCEMHDDIMLVWREEGDEVFEFVQVKNWDLDQFWTPARLCQPSGPSADSKSIIEKSLENDRGPGRCRFSFITSGRFHSDLRPITLPRSSGSRSGPEFVELQNRITVRLGDVTSPNGNDVGFWLANVECIEIGQQTDLEAKNTLRLQQLSELFGFRLTTQQADHVYLALLAMVQAAAVARWNENPAGKRVERAQLESWLRSKCAELANSPAAVSGPSVSEALKVYRARVADLHARWDSEQIQLALPSHATPAAVPLEAMYVPLMLTDPVTGTSVEVDVNGLLTMSPSLVVRGPSGCGKTTWLRWIFRRLLDSTAAVPVYLSVRAIARHWSTSNPRGFRRSLDDVIRHEVSQYVPEAADLNLPGVLEDADAPRLVLLVDGWDEVGPFGSELRTKVLGFLKHHRRAIAIVTSRPYGTSRPSASDGFVVVNCSPLSDDAIKDLSHRYFAVACKQESPRAAELAEAFFGRVRQSARSHAMARTPLLLLMMLHVSGRGNLPTRLHKLYEACLEPLLTTLPATHSPEATDAAGEYWWPDGADDCLDVVSTLAARTWDRSTTHAWSFDELERWLPSPWPTTPPRRLSRKSTRLRFLRWLAGPGNLLDEQADGTVSFRHGSFRDYFAARAFMREQRPLNDLWRAARTSDSWNTLRVLALMLADSDPRAVDTAIEEWVGEADEAALCFAGTLLADGLGSDDRVSSWAARFLLVFEGTWPDDAEECVVEWARRPKDARSGVLRAELERVMRVASFSALGRLQDLGIAWGVTDPNLLREDNVAKEIVHWLQGRPSGSARQIGAARFLSLGVALWPGIPRIAALNLWPSRRRTLGLRLQLAVACGATREDLVRCAAAWFGDETDARLTSRAASILSERFAALLGGAHGGDVRLDPWLKTWIDEVARAWSRKVVPELVRLCGPNILDDEYPSAGNEFAQALSPFGFEAWAGYCTDWALRIAMSLKSPERAAWDDAVRILKDARYWGWTWMNYWAVVRPRDFGRSISWSTTPILVRQWAEALRTKMRIRETAKWVEDFVWFDWNACGAFGLHSRFAALQVTEQPISLLGIGCRRRMNIAVSDHELDQLARAPASADKPWGALARCLAGCGTPLDLGLLHDISRNPAACGNDLADIVRYMVRGDLVLDDGLEISLDELAAEAGIPAPDHLESDPP